MRLITSKNNNCVAAALAMITCCRSDCGTAEEVERRLFHDPPTYPFPELWKHLPLVPCMAEICDWLMSEFKFACTPFPRNPLVSPHPDCPGVSPWNEDPEWVFEQQLELGVGLLEGTTGNVGHMCAWDGELVYDPRGYIYSLNSANLHNYAIKTFWLVTKVQDESN